MGRLPSNFELCKTWYAQETIDCWRWLAMVAGWLLPHSFHRPRDSMTAAAGWLASDSRRWFTAGSVSSHIHTASNQPTVSMFTSLHCPATTLSFHRSLHCCSLFTLLLLLARAFACDTAPCAASTVFALP